MGAVRGGLCAYASGHGIHLAANSVSNVSPGPTAHLWDEVVGHYIWYAGVALVLAAIADTMTSRPRPPWWAYVLSVGVGLTWATNALGGGTEVLGVIIALGAVLLGWRRRASLAAVLWVGFAPAVGILVVASFAG